MVFWEEMRGELGLSGKTGSVARAQPREWLPLLVDAYQVLDGLAREAGVGVVVAGAGAFAVHVEAEPTKYIGFVLSKPIPLEGMGRLLQGLALEDVLRRASEFDEFLEKRFGYDILVVWTGF